MAPRSSHLKSLLFAASLLTTSTTAQNITNTTTPDICDESAEQAAEYPINATGTANVADLRVSLTFGDRRNESGNLVSWTYAFLSAPENSTEQVCVYMFEGMENNRQGDGENGCGGVLPQACVDLIEQELTLPDNLLDLTDAPGNYQCPPGIGLYRDEWDEACGSEALSGNVLSTGTSSLPPLDANHAIQSGIC
jgi:hypothetical protein